MRPLLFTLALTCFVPQAADTTPGQLTTADFAGLWDFKVKANNGGLDSIFIFYLYADGTVDLAAENYYLYGTFSIGPNNIFSMRLNRLSENDELTPDFQLFTSDTPATKTAIFGTFEEMRSSGDFPYDNFTAFEARPHDLTFATSLGDVQIQTKGTFSASESISRTFKKGVAYDSGSFSMTATLPFPKKSIHNQIIDQYTHILFSFGNFHQDFSPLQDERYVPGASKFKVSIGDNDIDKLIQMSLDVSDSENIKIKLKSKYIHEAGKPAHGYGLLGRMLLGHDSGSTSPQVPILIEYFNNSFRLDGTADITLKTDSKGKSKVSAKLTAGGAK